MWRRRRGGWRPITPMNFNLWIENKNFGFHFFFFIFDISRVEIVDDHKCQTKCYKWTALFPKSIHFFLILQKILWIFSTISNTCLENALRNEKNCFFSSFWVHTHMHEYHIKSVCFITWTCLREKLVLSIQISATFYLSWALMTLAIKDLRDFLFSLFIWCSFREKDSRQIQIC